MTTLARQPVDRAIVLFLRGQFAPIPVGDGQAVQPADYRKLNGLPDPVHLVVYPSTTVPTAVGLVEAPADAALRYLVQVVAALPAAAMALADRVRGAWFAIPGTLVSGWSIALRETDGPGAPTPIGSLWAIPETYTVRVTPSGG